MQNPLVWPLLEHVIDTPIKLQLVLLFHESAGLCTTPTQLAQRAYRDIWSTREALRELAEDGVLQARADCDEPQYQYRSRAEHTDAIDALVQSYNEPLTRDALLSALREIAGDAPYRRALRGGVAFESITM